MSPEEALHRVARLLQRLEVLAINPGIDRSYVERWAAEPGVLGLWREITD